MTLLAIETSCDETAVAIVRNGSVKSSLVSSQVDLHAEYGGVVPELATREHLRNLPPLLRQALQEAGAKPADLTAIAATRGPGLPSALLVGLKTAQSLAYVLRLPFVGVHHHEAHLYSPWLTGQPACAQFDPFQAHVSLIVSGGHTLLVHVRKELDHTVLGSTLDDAAGECFDKTAKLLGLPYPGGPEVDRLARQGNPERFRFPRPLLNEPHHDFSFSGLKTAVRYHLRDHPQLSTDPTALPDLCAGIQSAIVEVLVVKTVRAARHLGVNLVTASGGVTCNRALREQLATACARRGLALRLTEARFCTDNAAMIGILAERKLARGHRLTPLDAEPAPSWPLDAGRTEPPVT